jgi:hypothetical protein
MTMDNIRKEIDYFPSIFTRISMFLGGFSEFLLFIVEKGILIRLSWVLLYKNYSMRWLSNRENDFIAC